MNLESFVKTVFFNLRAKVLQITLDQPTLYLTKFKVITGSSLLQNDNKRMSTSGLNYIPFEAQCY